ncbi:MULTISPECIES: cupredoxin domain-containing protein [Halobacterium]|uniref:cupredoxin domain-containing protein n=1 Tax=Halobacterium TaxID=2239 RepID=UPI00196484FE|nr:MULTISPECIES: plastocyanin/azurin family copper-binding protein [Halobacterium]MCF2208574.1 halocyanin [Halobacterium salinarum]MCF2239135.1 halocyanin [Halobacterium salinarum]MCF2241949.1 halocyanin [Halobacterium salinarum]MDL0127287.1 plastocyanin/azurin family copper-binding protein [Halobacterium salinarum]QRY23296.1 halocyanin [Halobacterium sp. GSL-19]
MHRRAFLAGGTTLSVGVLAGCIGPSVSKSDYDIGMVSNGFVPQEPVEDEDMATHQLTAGDTVTWANTGSRNHTVTAYGSGLPEGASYFASGGFDTEPDARRAWQDNVEGGGNISPGATYEVTLTVPGEYYYFCIPHEGAGMRGKLVVDD